MNTYSELRASLPAIWIESILESSIEISEPQALNSVLERLVTEWSADVLLVLDERFETHHVANHAGSIETNWKGILRSAIDSGYPEFLVESTEPTAHWHLAFPIRPSNPGLAGVYCEGRGGELIPLLEAGNVAYLHHVAHWLRVAWQFDRKLDWGSSRHGSPQSEDSRGVLKQPLEVATPARKIPALAERKKLRQLFPDIVAQSAVMRSILMNAAELADSDIPILIEGESGTGKELVARGIHLSSRRADRSFVCENCGAMPDSLIEAELFGYEKGAFTGANSSQPGLLERADGGTLFLDEIGEMGLDQQKKLLRVLQERKVRRIGSSTTLELDFRLISATNRVLEDMIRSGLFRDDLYYRVGVAVLTLPPLRERKSDIPYLIDHLNHGIARELGRDPVRFSRGAFEYMTEHNWPGNVRELRNEIWRHVATRKSIVRANQLSPRIRRARSTTISRGQANGCRSLFEIETNLLGQVIRDALVDSDGNVTQAAKLLDVPRSTLRRRMHRYKLVNW